MSPLRICHDAAGIAGNLFAMVLFLSPISTFRRIKQRESTEQFSALAYIFALLNCLVCMWYGMPFVSSDNILLTIINATGASFQLAYVLIYMKYSPKGKSGKVLALLLSVLLFFIVMALVTTILMERPLRTSFVGVLSVVTLSGMFASPLSIMKLVIETKSVEYMPFYLSLSMFLMSSSFFAYGLFGHDAFVAVPNGFGSVLGFTQLWLYFYYKSLDQKASASRSWLLPDMLWVMQVPIHQVKLEVRSRRIKKR